MKQAGFTSALPFGLAGADAQRKAAHTRSLLECHTGARVQGAAWTGGGQPRPTQCSRRRGFFRTELLTEQSTNFAAPSIADYDERRAKQHEFWKGQNGQQSGDPAKLAQAILAIASQEPPPRRFIAGADAVATAEQVAIDLKAQTEASTSLGFDERPGRTM